jgi:hypothetical protein
MPAAHYATGLQLDQLQVNHKPVVRESQVARLAIKAAAHYATGLQLDSVRPALGFTECEQKSCKGEMVAMIFVEAMPILI